MCSSANASLQKKISPLQLLVSSYEGSSTVYCIHSVICDFTMDIAKGDNSL